MQRCALQLRIIGIQVAVMLIAACASACVLFAQAAWAEPAVSGGITWEYNDDEKTLTIAPAGENECEEGFRSGQMPDYMSANAPWNAYNSDTGMERIVVSEGVLHLGTYMYGTSRKSYSSLKSVSMPESLTSIGDGTKPVIKSSALADLRIPENVTQVGAKSFLNCTNLKSVQLSYGVFATNDGSLSSAFPSSATISRYSLGEGEDDLLWRDSNGEGASWSFYKTYPVNDEAKSNVLVFEGTGSTADYTALMDGTGRAAYQSYTGDDAVQAVVVKDGITRIGSSLFYQMSGVGAWEIADSVKEIGDTAFSGAGLSDMSLFPSVEVIGANAFSGNSFTKLVIPASVETIGEGAFTCRQLVDISAEKGSKLASVGQNVFGSKADGGMVDLSNCANLKSLDVASLFRGSAVDTFILPEGLETFGVKALVNESAKDIGMIVFPGTLSNVVGDISAGFDYLKGITLTHGSSFVLASEGASSLAEALSSKCEALGLVAGQQFDFGGIADKNGFSNEAVLAKTKVLMKFESAEKPAVYRLATSDADLVDVSDGLVDAGDGVWTLSVPASETGLYAATITKEQADADAVAAQIAALPSTDELKLDDAEAVSAAQEALESLSDDAAALVPAEAKATLKAAAATVRALQAEAEAVQAAKDACEAAGIAYDAEKSVAENIAAAQAAANAAAQQAVADAEQAKKDADAAKAAQAKAEADLAAVSGDSARLASIAKNVKTVTVDVKTVDAAAIAKAIAAVGGDAKYVTTIVLGPKVKTIKASAFKACKNVKTLQVQTKKLTKKSVKKSLKGSKVKTVQVNVATAKAHNKLVKKYKKIFTKKIAGKKVAVK